MAIKYLDRLYHIAKENGLEKALKFREKCNRIKNSKQAEKYGKFYSIESVEKIATPSNYFIDSTIGLLISAGITGPLAAGLFWATKEIYKSDDNLGKFFAITFMGPIDLYFAAGTMAPLIYSAYMFKQGIKAIKK